MLLLAQPPLTYTSAGRPDTNTPQDWEVRAAYLAYLKRYGTRKEGILIGCSDGRCIPMGVRPRLFCLPASLPKFPESLADSGDLRPLSWRTPYRIF